MSFHKLLQHSDSNKYKVKLRNMENWHMTYTLTDIETNKKTRNDDAHGNNSTGILTYKTK